MNKETVHSVNKKSMYRNVIQLNTVTKERANEEGLINHRKKKEKRREKKRKEKKRQRERKRSRDYQGLHATEIFKKKKN